MTSIIGILPLLLGWVGVFCLARELAARKHIDSDWRLSFAFASVGWGAILTLIVELGSIGRLLTAANLWISWVLVDLALFGAAISLARKRGVQIRDAWREALKRTQAGFREWPLDARCYLGITTAFAIFLFVVAVSFATTNWDSLTYHLARIMHWAQQGSVDHFATNNSRQIEFAPWQSFLGMMLYLLWGGDRLLNLVQWCAMTGSLILISYMVKGLGVQDPEKSAVQRYRTIGFALIVAVTIPIGLVECMNPQNDYTAAFWLCCLTCFALALFREPANGLYMLGAGLACGLGVLTKSTIYVYAAPLILAFGGWWIVRKIPFRSKVRYGAVFCMVFFALNVGHAMRNQGVFGSPLGSKHIFALEKNNPVSVSGTAANVVRNLFLHSVSGIPPVTTVLQKVLSEAHMLTGRTDVDPETTYRGKFYISARFHIFDSFASATYHVLLIFGALALALCNVKRYRVPLLHAAWVIASFILFCAYLKWQYNHSRLHLPYLVLLAPVIAVVLADKLPRWSVGTVCAGLVLFAGYSLASNVSRPFFKPDFAALPREQQHLTVHGQGSAEPLVRIADTIAASGCESVGLKLDFDDAEYAIWAMLRNRGYKGTLHHVYVENESARIPSLYPEPSVVIARTGTPGPVVARVYPFVTTFRHFMILSKTRLVDGTEPVQEFSKNQ
jgi:4-amino-4-deoxy-L-arabinose transferase-like glycosyltransferase